jgi:hypothetical protein
MQFERQKIIDILKHYIRSRGSFWTSLSSTNNNNQTNTNTNTNTNINTSKTEKRYLSLFLTWAAFPKRNEINQLLSLLAKQTNIKTQTQPEEATKNEELNILFRISHSLLPRLNGHLFSQLPQILEQESGLFGVQQQNEGNKNKEQTNKQENQNEKEMNNKQQQNKKISTPSNQTETTKRK